MATLSVKKLVPDAFLPKRGSDHAAGFDLYCYKKEVVPACKDGVPGKAMVDTGIAIATPPGTYARIAARSGNSRNHSIEIGAGVVDHDYRGPLVVILYNFSAVEKTFNPEDRVAQMILERYDNEAIVEHVTTLPETKRGAGGFGSTGN